jgi:hypothetical protein
MKIKHTDGSITDTHKLSDFSAELAEKSHEFVDFCCKRKIPFLLSWVDPTNNKCSGGNNYNDSMLDMMKVIWSINVKFKLDEKNKDKDTFQMVPWNKVKHLFDNEEGNI